MSMCSFAACTIRTQQKNEVHSNDSTSVINENEELDSALIVSLIQEDERRRNIWSYDFKQSESSPLFYEAICDEGLYLYRIVKQNQKMSVVMLEDENIGELRDFFTVEPKDTIGVEYKHEGAYKVLNDSTVIVFFEKIWTNYCATCDSSEQEFTYHIQCIHCYKFSNMAFEKIKADTVVLTDEREQFFGEEIRKLIY